MDKNISRKFFNDQAEHWDDTAGNTDPEKLRWLADHMIIPKDAWILDVGTGTGVFLPYLKEITNNIGKIICVDFAFKMLTIAQNKNNDHLTHYICSEIETLRFCCELFDAVICFSAFPHFHDKPLALSKIFTILKPGGGLYICHSASRETINNIHQNIPDFQDHLLPGKDEMNELFSTAGYGFINIEEHPDYYLASARK